MKMYFTSNTLECPACKTPTVFRSGATNIKVCAVCNTVMERLEGEGLVKKLSLPAIKTDTSGLIKIGTRGNYKNKQFEVIGCLHCNFKRYLSKRFTILYTDGSIGVLTQTGGFLAVHENIVADFPSRLPTVQNLKLGTEKTDLLRGSQAFVTDAATTAETKVEGEVLFTDTDGIFSTTELADNDGKRFEMVEHEKNRFELYTVNHEAYESFGFTQVNQNPISPVTIACEKCRRSVTIQLPQHSTNCVCVNCGAWNQIVNGNRLSYKGKKFGTWQPAIPVNASGTINGTEYKVMGACVKTESGSMHTSWREYTLYNSKNGFAYLAEYDGHWTFLKEVKLGALWPAYQNELEVDGKVYDLFNDYAFDFKHATGEFLAALNGGNTMVREYIAPPVMYSAEFDHGKELVWFKGEFISGQDVFDGFGIQQHLPPAVKGVGPLQTISFSANRKFLGGMALIAAAIFFIAALWLESNSAKKIVYQNTFFLPDSVLSKGLTTNSFELTKASSNLQFVIVSRVNNSWFEAAVTLTNEVTGKEYNFEKGVEYYSGYSDGESWTEGSQDDEVILSSIPKGKYHLNIFPSFGTKADEQSFSLTVVNDVPMWRNFYILVSILMLYPIVMWWRNNSFEQKRWNASTYNPFKKDDDEN